MKSKIEEYLKSDRSFEAGVLLYMQFGKNLGFKTVLNRHGFSDYNHRTLLEELRKLADISPADFQIALDSKVPVEKKSVTLTGPVDAGSDQDRIKQIQEIPVEIRKTIKIRDEFPFLSSPDCPNELKILLADRITAYHNYVEGHKKLFESLTDEELQEVCSSIVENYLENCEIWDELKYYKETGKLLGKHAVYAELDRIKEIQAMTTPELVKLKKSLENNLARTKQKIKEQPDHQETGKRINRVDNWQVELTEVNRLLGIK